MLKRSNTNLFKIIAVIMLGLLSFNFCKAQIFVNLDARGNNDGSSWEHAYNNLHIAIDNADNGNQIWVAAGTYLSGKNGIARISSYHIKNGIQLYGGFEGSELVLSERNPSKYLTVLSGDIHQDDIENDFKSNRNDNSWTVMLIENTSSVIPVIDGFTIAGGHSNGNKNSFVEKNGGGLILFGPAIIRNCIFSQNYSSERGGALFLVDSLGTKNQELKIDNCQFRNNQSFSGGAVNLTLSSNRLTSVIIKKSNFSDNLSEEDGAGLSVDVRANGTNILIDTCNFTNNYSSFTGGAISSQFYGNGNSLVTQNSNFSDNQSKASGGAILMYSNRSSADNTYHIKNCFFKNNATTHTGSGQKEGGGAVYVATAGNNISTYIESSQFLENKSKGFGGALGIRNKKPGVRLFVEVDNCQFEKNEADNGGGLFYEAESIRDSLIVRQCQFKENSISDLHPGQATRGGAIHIAYHSKSKESRTFIEHCTFNENQTKEGDGGGLAISPFGQGSFSRIKNSSFIGNTSASNGGAFFYMGADGAYELSDCRFDNNQARESGPLLYEYQTFGNRQFYILFHGVLWFQIFYSLILFLISRERTTGFYAVMLVGISLFFAVAFHAMYFPLLNNFSGGIKTILYQAGVFLSIFGLIKFAQNYLIVNEQLPRFKKITFYFLNTFLFFELIFFALQFGVSGDLGNITKVIVGFTLLLFFAIGGLIPIVWVFLTFRKGFKPAKYFLLAMLLAGGALLWLAASYLEHGSVLGIPITSIEALLLLSIITLALADGYRINSFKKEKERAERLKELDIAKTRLYTNITHEFRTPLTVIMGATDQVKDNAKEKSLINRNSKQLLQLINQMLDLSKLEGGALKLDPLNGNIIPFVEYLVESYQSLADSKHIRLTCYSEDEAIQMDYDADKMQQIVTNLISNAIKFTSESGKVVLHTKKETIKGRPYLSMVVKDNGIGIPLDELQHVFDRFYQVDSSDMRRSEGSGIGLALVKELVQLMKGQIDVSSNIDEGTIFNVRIPITNVAKQQSEDINVKENLVLTNNVKTQTTGSYFTPTMSDLPIALIIEDNKDIVSFLRSCLQKSYRIEVAFNGQQGINKALEIIPDVIISDVMMPEADGYTVCKTLKNDGRTSHVPIILLTAKATQEDKVAGLDAGADAYLSKPFHKEELEVRLQKLVELRQKLQLRYQKGGFDNDTRNKEDDFIKKIRAIILENIEDENFGVNDVCRSIKLSRMQVHRKLKALTNLPTTSFINMVRLEEAKKLLSETDLNVSEVAYRVGFSNHSYFTKLFVNQYANTPSELSKSE